MSFHSKTASTFRLPAQAAFVVAALLTATACTPTAPSAALDAAECDHSRACPPSPPAAGARTSKQAPEDFPPPPPESSGDLAIPSTADLPSPVPGVPPAETDAIAPSSGTSLPEAIPLAAPPEAPARTTDTPATSSDGTPPQTAAVLPAQHESLRLTAEALFGPGAYRLTRAARASLDDTVRIVRREAFSRILISGHSDRSGLPGEDQRTSQRRAESVRAYLVTKGLPADRMQVDGRGTAQATVSPSGCARRKGAARAACFQPDRRVHIRVVR